MRPYGTDHATVSELTLHAENTAAVYTSATLPTIKNLCRKIARGVYTSARAADAFGHVAEVAARSYCKEYGSRADVWHVMFPPASRRAAVMLDRFESEYRANGYEGINPVPVDRRAPLPPVAA